MHFMILILLFLLVVVIWGFFHSNPTGVPPARLWLVNGIIILIAVIASGVGGSMLYEDAILTKADEKGMATYLAIMATGTAFLIVVAAGGLLRNLVVFPIGKRAQAADTPTGDA